MIYVMKIPAYELFRAARAFFVFDHIPICTLSVAEYLNNNNGNQDITSIPETLYINFRKNVLHINIFISILKVAGKNFWLVYDVQYMNLVFSLCKNMRK